MKSPRSKSVLTLEKEGIGMSKRCGMRESLQVCSCSPLLGFPNYLSEML